MRSFIRGVVLRSVNSELFRSYKSPNFTRCLSTNAPSDNSVDRNRNTGSFESADDFERMVLGNSFGNSSSSSSFFQKLDEIERARNRSRRNDGNRSYSLDDLDESSTTLHDGLEDTLQRAAMDYEYDSDEDDSEDEYRPDVNFDGPTYDIKDLDLTKPGVHKPKPQEKFVVTTEEVLEKADFRNVRFLANFITDAGIIIKRSQTGISAKAQRKVAREIKTARAFGLMPFTTMGTKSFVFGRSMEDLDEAYEYETFDGRLVADDNDNDPLGS